MDDVTIDPRVAEFERERADAVELAHRAMATSYIGAPPPGLRGDADRMVAALLKAGWTPPAEPITEHAIRMAGGDMQVRNRHPETERIYPLAQWIKAMHTVHQVRVYKRRIIVVDDWTEVPLANPGPPPPGPDEQHAPGCIPNFYGPGSHTCGPIPKEPDRG